jgi:D-lyxose ketol-isomerase
MNRKEAERIRGMAAEILRQARVVMKPEELRNMEVADLGLGDIQRVGLQVVIYANNDRYCAKELVLLPHQICLEHRHPPIDKGNIGKQETFRCRWGEAYLYVPGVDTPSAKAVVPETYGKYLTVRREVILQPGDQYTLKPGEKHWFQAGPEGAVISEFSSTSVDEEDIYTDPRVKRVHSLGNRRGD